MSNNPPAFWGHGGVTLRDYIAAKAMQVILQSLYDDEMYVDIYDNDFEHECARSAYIVADAMLKAREITD